MWTKGYYRWVWECARIDAPEVWNQMRALHTLHTRPGLRPTRAAQDLRVLPRDLEVQMSRKALHAMKSSNARPRLLWAYAQYLNSIKFHISTRRTMVIITLSASNTCLTFSLTDQCNAMVMMFCDALFNSHERRFHIFGISSPLIHFQSVGYCYSLPMTLINDVLWSSACLAKGYNTLYLSL